MTFCLTARKKEEMGAKGQMAVGMGQVDEK
jgi:hypothetical protein